MNFSSTQVYSSAKWCLHLTPWLQQISTITHFLKRGLLWLAISEVPPTTHWLSCFGPEVPQYIMVGTYGRKQLFSSFMKETEVPRSTSRHIQWSDVSCFLQGHREIGNKSQQVMWTFQIWMLEHTVCMEFNLFFTQFLHKHPIMIFQ